MYTSERLKGIDVFVSVAQCGSFTAAAERMNLTTSAVSKGIARLEKRLGIRLFDRTTRQLSLTDSGAVFYKTCVDVLADLEGAETCLTGRLTEPWGRVRIDLPAGFGRTRVLPEILRFVEAHKMIMPRITLSDRMVDPIEDNIDIFVRIGGPDIWPVGIEHQYLGKQRQIFVASPAYLDRHGTPQNLRQLEEHGCILYSKNDGSTFPLHFSGARPGDEEMRPIPGRIAIGDPMGQLYAVEAGHGIAQLPTWLVQGPLDQGSLVQVLPDLATNGLPINLAWQKSREHLPKVQALLQALSSLSPL